MDTLEDFFLSNLCYAYDRTIGLVSGTRAMDGFYNRKDFDWDDAAEVFHTVRHDVESYISTTKITGKEAENFISSFCFYFDLDYCLKNVDLIKITPISLAPTEILTSLASKYKVDVNELPALGTSNT